MNFLRITTILLLCFLATGLSAQKKLLKKANELYKLKQYTGAIELYEQALKETSSLSASAKLANAYRLTNQTEKAEAWYSQIVENDKAKPITYYLYAESLMSNGKYDLAKNWFLKYNEEEPNNQDAIRMAYACDRVKTLEPYFPNIEVKYFEHNSEADDGAPVAINDGIAFTSDRPQAGINPLKQKSGWTGRDYQRIYFSRQNRDRSFEKPGNFSKKLNELNMHSGPVSFSADKQLAVFSRSASVPDKNNTHNIQLFSAVSEDGDKWKKVELLSFCKPDKNYMHPALSPDGTKLYFVSDKAGGLGGTDIYVSEKTGDKWGSPKNLGPVINTASNEAFPFFHESGKLFFASKGHLSYGGYDILFSNLKEDFTWQKPVNIGKPINSSQDDISIYLNTAMDAGYFVSSREGGDDDIYIFNVLAGINADLEEIDFDEASNGGPEIERIKVPLGENPGNPVADKEVADKVIANTEVTLREEPNQMKNDKIRTTSKAIDAPREKAVVNNDDSPVPAPADTNTPLKQLDPPAGTPANNKNTQSTEEASIVANTITANAAPPENEAPANEADELSEINNKSNLSLTTNQPSTGQEPSQTVEVNKPVSQKEKTSLNDEAMVTTSANSSETNSKKAVNLMIPAKESEKEQAKNTSLAISNTENKEKEAPASTVVTEKLVQNPIEAPSAPIGIEESEKETETPVASEATETITTDPITSEEESSPPEEVLNENTQILDRAPVETAAPVLLGEDETILSEDKPKNLTKLAELLQTGQSVANSSFYVRGVNYATGSFLLSPESTRSLASLTDLLEMHPDLNIEIGSHTSARGGDIENHNLSTKRARSIKAYLVYKGIDGNRIEAKGYGETRLLNGCSNGVRCTPEEHAENDRIEVKVKQ